MASNLRTREHIFSISSQRAKAKPYQIEQFLKLVEEHQLRLRDDA